MLGRHKLCRNTHLLFCTISFYSAASFIFISRPTRAGILPIQLPLHLGLRNTNRRCIEHTYLLWFYDAWKCLIRSKDTWNLLGIWEKNVTNSWTFLDVKIDSVHAIIIGLWTGSTRLLHESDSCFVSNFSPMIFDECVVGGGREPKVTLRLRKTSGPIR